MKTARKISIEQHDAVNASNSTEERLLAASSAESEWAPSPARTLQAQLSAAYGEDASVDTWSLRRRVAIIAAMGLTGWAVVGLVAFAVVH